MEDPVSMQAFHLRSSEGDAMEEGSVVLSLQCPESDESFWNIFERHEISMVARVFWWRSQLTRAHACSPQLDLRQRCEAAMFCARARVCLLVMQCGAGGLQRRADTSGCAYVQRVVVGVGLVCHLTVPQCCNT